MVDAKGLVSEIEELIDAYWDFAFVEGETGRKTDDPEGSAQRTRSAISERLRALSTVPADGLVIPAEVTSRYWNMLPVDLTAVYQPVPGTSPHHIKWMLQELRTMKDDGKAMRWLGFIQGVMIERGYTTVSAERDFTRPFFANALRPQVTEEECRRAMIELSAHWERSTQPTMEIAKAALLAAKGL